MNKNSPQKTDNAIVAFDDSTYAKIAVYAKIRDWFLKNELFTGEQIYQCDCFSETDIKDLFTDLAENIFDFIVDWDGD